MSSVNAVTIYAENFISANIVAGNTSSNISIVANSVSVQFGNNLTINSSGIAISNISAPIYNTAINTTSVSTSAIRINDVEFDSVAPPEPGVDYQVFTNPSSINYWAKPSWAADTDMVTIMMWGGGGGGTGNAGFVAAGGGGACVIVNRLAGELNAVCNVVVGAAGVGNTTTTTSTAGGETRFYINSTSYISAFGGAATNGSATGVWQGGGGGGWFSAGTNGVGGGPLGGSPSATEASRDSTFGGGGGANNSTGNIAGYSVYGGGGGGWASLSSAGGLSIYGGGGGGGITGNSVFGGNGGLSNLTTTAIHGYSPGGGGGSNTSNGGRGGNGAVRIWVTPSAIGGSAETFYSIVPNKNYLFENNSISYTVTTIGVPNGTTLYYTLNNASTANSADFTTAVNGSVVINGGSNTFTLVTSNNDTSTETIKMDLRTDSSTGNIVTSSITSTIYPNTISYSLTANSVDSSGLGTSSFTLTDVNIGAEASDRLVVFAISGGTTNQVTTTTSINSVVINGINANIHVQAQYSTAADNYYNQATAICSAVIPTGTTANVDIEFNTGAAISQAMSVCYRVTGYTNSSPYAFATIASFKSNTTISNTISVDDRSIIIGGGMSRAQSTYRRMGGFSNSYTSATTVTIQSTMAINDLQISNLTEDSDYLAGTSTVSVSQRAFAFAAWK